MCFEGVDIADYTDTDNETGPERLTHTPGIFTKCETAAWNVFFFISVYSAPAHTQTHFSFLTISPRVSLSVSWCQTPSFTRLVLSLALVISTGHLLHFTLLMLKVQSASHDIYLLYKHITVDNLIYHISGPDTHARNPRESLWGCLGFLE